MQYSKKKNDKKENCEYSVEKEYDILENKMRDNISKIIQKKWNVNSSTTEDDKRELSQIYLQKIIDETQNEEQKKYLQNLDVQKWDIFTLNKIYQQIACEEITYQQMLMIKKMQNVNQKINNRNITNNEYEKLRVDINKIKKSFKNFEQNDDFIKIKHKKDNNEIYQNVKQDNDLQKNQNRMQVLQQKIQNEKNQFQQQIDTVQNDLNKLQKEKEQIELEQKNMQEILYNNISKIHNNQFETENSQKSEDEKMYQMQLNVQKISESELLQKVNMIKKEVQTLQGQCDQEKKNLLIKKNNLKDLTQQQQELKNQSISFQSQIDQLQIQIQDKDLLLNDLKRINLQQLQMNHDLQQTQKEQNKKKEKFMFNISKKYIQQYTFKQKQDDLERAKLFAQLSVKYENSHEQSYLSLAKYYQIIKDHKKSFLYYQKSLQLSKNPQQKFQSEKTSQLIQYCKIQIYKYDVILTFQLNLFYALTIIFQLFVDMFIKFAYQSLDISDDLQKSIQIN